MSRWRAALGVLVSAVVCGVAAAQGLVPRTALPGLTRIDEVGDDADPLSRSQRFAPVDLRMPTGFEGVYRFKRTTPFGQSQTMTARMDGGLIAVFPNSVYVPARGGLIPAVPAGTVYVIGGVSALGAAQEEHRPAASPTAVDLRAPSSVFVPRAPEPSAPTQEPAQSVWTSEYLRRARVEAMLRSIR
jgi:hypothetical protein